MLDSVFTQRERENHIRDEAVYIKVAKGGNLVPISKHWYNKKNDYLERICNLYEKDGRKKCKP